MNENVKVWEEVEVVRSASEAKKNKGSDLRIADDILHRYKTPSTITPFPLEYAYALLGNVDQKTVLDYGSGAGDNTILLANHGAYVIGVDISPEQSLVAEERARIHGFAENVEIKVGSAHELPLEDDSVDIVFGMAILHHLDLELSSKEIHRVLKPGGRAIFMEPVRNSRIYTFLRNLIPYKSPDVSPYERPLTNAEVLQYSSAFQNFRARSFHLPFVNLLEVLGVPQSIHFTAIRLDGRLLRWFPFLSGFATVKVFEITK